MQGEAPGSSVTGVFSLQGKKEEGELRKGKGKDKTKGLQMSVDFGNGQ